MATTKFGEFSTTGYIGIGDPYVKKTSHSTLDQAAFRPSGTTKQLK